MANEQTQAEQEPQAIDQDLPKDEAEQMTSLHERGIAALSYVGFLAIVPFYLKKDSKFCRFHGKQGLLIAIVFFFAKLLLVIDLFMDFALVLQFLIFVKMGFAALSGKWEKMPWIYNSSCKLEETLSLETKEQEQEKTNQT
ncbi:MAG: hypothetical protein V1908_02045 [Candidatus Peregrinibacteria bacterium]